MSVIALIPAYNEAASIGATVTAARSVPTIDRVVVVDDASDDNTGQLARAAGAEMLRLPENRGKGGALQAGLDHIGQTPDILVLLDGDLGKTAAEATALVAPILEARADMTVAVLPHPGHPAGFGLVKSLARTGIRTLSGYDAAAPLSGQRALSGNAVSLAMPFARGFGVEVALTVRVYRAGGRIVEVPTTMRHAATGRNLAGFVHRGKQLLSVAAALVRLGFERQSVGDSGG